MHKVLCRRTFKEATFLLTGAVLAVKNNVPLILIVEVNETFTVQVPLEKLKTGHAYGGNMTLKESHIKPEFETDLDVDVEYDASKNTAKVVFSGDSGDLHITLEPKDINQVLPT